MAKKTPKAAQRARIAVEKWREYFKYNIDQYHQMTQFVLGRQWTDDEEDMLVKTLNKVPLQFNKLATLANTLLGEQQQNTPQVEVNPLSNCDEQTAELRQMIVKDIMLSSNTKTVYQRAAFQAIIGGYGAFVIDTDYRHEKSFDQDIIYRAVKDPTRCYWDMSAEEINKQDGMRCGYITRMSRAKFRQIYGKKVEEKIKETKTIGQNQEEIALATQPISGGGDDPFAWADDESITIIHDFARVYTPDMLYKLSNGDEVNQEELDEIIEKSKEFLRNQQEAQRALAGEMEMVDDMEGFPMESEEIETVEFDLEILDRMTLYIDGQPIRIVDSKSFKHSKIMQKSIAGDYTLEASEFPSDDLPVIFVDQNSFYDKNGKQVCRPFVIDAIDTQRFINYLGTQVAYLLKISRYDQFIGSKKNVASIDTAAQWRDPGQVKGMLTYDETPTGAKPEQLRPPEISQSLLQQYQRAIEDLYTSTGLYPTRLGQAGGEVSGAAIDARTRQGSYPTFVVFNSINCAITAGGTIVNQMVPRVYDTERVISLMTPDKGRRNITINKQQDEYGAKIENDLTKGTFEVILQAGPSYEGQKQQALESLNSVLAANPQAFPLVADLYAANLPLVNTLELQNRFKTLVPPEILEAGKTGESPQQQQKGPDPEQQKLMMEAQDRQQKIELQKQKLEMEMVELQAKMEMQKKEMELKHLEFLASLEEQKMRVLAETDRTQSDSAIAHANNITKLIHAHYVAQQKENTQQKRG